MKLLLLLTIFSLWIGCATSSGVVEMGRDSYMISRTGSIGKMGVGNMKTDNIIEANKFCKNAGKSVQMLSTQEFPATVGNTAHSELQFMCLDKGDSRLKGGTMIPVSPASADKLIDKN